MILNVNITSFHSKVKTGAFHCTHGQSSQTTRCRATTPPTPTIFVFCSLLWLHWDSLIKDRGGEGVALAGVAALRNAVRVELAIRSNCVCRITSLSSAWSLCPRRVLRVCRCRRLLRLCAVFCRRYSRRIWFYWQGCFAMEEVGVPFYANT